MLDSCDSKHDYLEFEKQFLNTRHKHAPKKTKINWGNYYPYVKKTLSKVITRRPQLQNKANRSPSDFTKYKK